MPFKWAFLMTLVIMTVTIGFVSLGFVPEESAEAFKNLDKDLNSFNSTLGASVTTDVNTGNSFDIAAGIGSIFNNFFTVGGAVLRAGLDIATIILGLPLTTLTIINSFPGIPSPIKSIVGTLVVVVMMFGFFFLILQVKGVLQT